MMLTMALAAWIACGLLACAVNGYIEDKPFTERDGTQWAVGFPVAFGALTLLWIGAKLATRAGSKARTDKLRLAEQARKELAEAQKEIDALLKRGAA